MCHRQLSCALGNSRALSMILVRFRIVWICSHFNWNRRECKLSLSFTLKLSCTLIDCHGLSKRLNSRPLSGLTACALLQVIVWGDYGRMDRKVFMGVVQILLDELDLSNLVIGWYKLFSTSSMCDPPLPSSPLGGSPKKSPGPSPRSSMNQGVASPMRGMSPLPTIIPPQGHMDNMDEEGDYVWVRLS